MMYTRSFSSTRAWFIGVFSLLLVCVNAPAFQWPTTNANVVPLGPIGYPLLLEEGRAISWSQELLEIVVKWDGTVVPSYVHELYPLSLVPTITNAVDVAQGGELAAALTEDGRVVTWGLLDVNSTWGGFVRPPAGLSNVQAIACAGKHVVALTTSGLVHAFGDNSFGQCLTPDGLTNVVAVGAGMFYSVALRQDGTVVGWGQVSLPPVSNVVQISCVDMHMLFLHRDGTVSAYPPAYDFSLTHPGLTNVVSVAAGRQDVAIRADGTIVMKPEPAPSWARRVKAAFSSEWFPSVLWITAPVVLEPPTNRVHAPGANAHFSLVATSRTHIAYSWLKQGAEIPGATSDSLTLTNLQFADSAIYAVVAEDAFGAVTNEFRLAVVASPVITIQPASCTVLENTTTNLSVEALSPEPLLFQWFFNATALPGATNSNLVFPAASTNQSGTYWVVAANSFGAVTSETARVEVKPAPLQDQSQRHNPAHVYLRSASEKFKYAQTFRPAISGRLAAIWVESCFGDPQPEYPTEFTLVDTIDGKPGTNFLGHISVRHLPCGGLMAYFASPEPYVESNTLYGLILSTEAPFTSGATYSFRTSITNAYPAGELCVDEAGWQVTQTDLAFVTYVYPEHRDAWLLQPNASSRVRVHVPLTLEAAPGRLVNQPAAATFTVNGTAVGTVTNPPYRLTWTPELGGPADIGAVFVDADSHTWPANPVTVSILPPSDSGDDFVARARRMGSYHVETWTNTSAGIEPGEPRLQGTLGQTIWREWTPPRSAQAAVMVPISDPGRTNVKVGIYVGGNLGALFPLTNGVGGCLFEAVGGTTYQIVLDSLATPVEGKRLILALNDLEITTPTNGANFTELATLNLAAERTDTQRVLERVELLCNDAPAGTLLSPPYAWSLTLAYPNIKTLRLRVQDSAGAITESKPVVVRVYPANDNFANATTIEGDRVTISTCNALASREAYDPHYASNLGGFSLWYRWTAPWSGVCTVSGRGEPNARLSLGAFVGARFSGLRKIAHNFPYPVPISFQAEAGTTYFIVVDSFTEGYGGPLHWSLELSPHNDDFYSRNLLTGDLQTVFTSTTGSTLDYGEALFVPPFVKSSLWWSWVPARDGQVEISATSTNTQLWIAVYTGEAVLQLQMLTNSGSSGAFSASIVYEARAGTNYQVAVYDCGAGGHFELQLRQAGLRITSPTGPKVLKSPAPIRLGAMVDGVPITSPAITFLVNDRVAGIATNVPYEVAYTFTEPGHYLIRAEALSTNGVLLSSLPLPLSIYLGADVPTPKVFSTRESASYILNSVGSLFAMGPAQGTFNIGSNSLLPHPQMCQWPAGVSSWRECNSLLALSADGALYEKGQTLVPLPPGVSRWVNLEYSIAVGDDGKAYRNGRELLTLGDGSLPWVQVVEGTAYQATRTADGRVFINPSYPGGEVLPPAGVHGWIDMKPSGGGLLLKGDDLQLYQIDDANYTRTASKVWLPAGVAHWKEFCTGSFHVLALADTGELYAWGRNFENQLGVMTPGEYFASPQKVAFPPGVTAWISIGAGSYHSLAVGNDCSLYGWGNNSVGQLGLRASPPCAVPTRLPLIKEFCALPVVYTHGLTSRQPDGSFKLEFRAEQNREYLIQYSDDLAHWKTAYPPVIGQGQTFTWFDAGPPATETVPDTAGNRFYRIVFAP